MDIEIYEEILFSYLFLRLPIIFFFSLAALGLEWMRSRLYQGRFYKPFLLNIILAWIPFLLSISAYILFLRSGFNETWTVLVLLAIWFVFFPNSVYLITEVHHFRDRFADDAKDPFWFDNIEILSIVGVGLLIGSHSLAIIHFLLRNHLTNALSWIAIISYVLLANFGIYIGRYLRFNSWDIVRNPINLFKQVINELSVYSKAKALVLYTFLFSFFIITFYLFVNLNIENLYTLGIRIQELQ
ncbi:DUF1361 domain-containing protein [Pleurocapsa sp. PCC 7319]|uniref:DUF1361 domain-containing protein n=1 Tax=Pleurocapsa sp. PCC 7319 TaxID=118161 RepID=UPI00034C27F7|nr:DUF1361 domain-containing protein [Pleurocapsa sp. PCC 7319]